MSCRAFTAPTLPWGLQTPSETHQAAVWGSVEASKVSAVASASDFRSQHPCRCALPIPAPFSLAPCRMGAAVTSLKRPGGEFGATGAVALAAPADDVLRLVADIEAQPAWHSGVTAARVVEARGDQATVVQVTPPRDRAAPPPPPPSRGPHTSPHVHIAPASAQTHPRALRYAAAALSRCPCLAPACPAQARRPWAGTFWLSAATCSAHTSVCMMCLHTGGATCALQPAVQSSSWRQGRGNSCSQLGRQLQRPTAASPAAVLAHVLVDEQRQALVSLDVDLQARGRGAGRGCSSEP